MQGSLPGILSGKGFTMKKIIKPEKIKKMTAVGIVLLLICSFSSAAFASESYDTEQEQDQTMDEDNTAAEETRDPEEIIPDSQLEEDLSENIDSEGSAAPDPALSDTDPEEEQSEENAPENTDSISQDIVPETNTSSTPEPQLPEPQPDSENEEITRFDFNEESTEPVSPSENIVIIPIDDIDFIDGAPEETKAGRLSFDLTDPFDLATADTPAPSLDDGTWKDYGLYYDYNYDTSSAAQWGAWGGNAHLTGQTYPDTNNNDISHAFGLYTDGENVKLYISYAGMFYAAGNGNDYNFMFNGSGYNGSESAKFRVVLEDGTDLSAARLEPGEYNLKIYHGDHAMSGYIADAYGTILIKPDNAYNEMEITIPISVMKEQNPDINTDVIQNIAFTSPNLMRGQVECAGASTAPGLSAFLAFMISGFGALLGAGKFRIFI